MDYLKIFNSEEEFKIEKKNLEEPWVSLIDGEIDSTLHYSSDPKFEMIDLGLPSGILWANMNIGATKEEEYGLYFQWGDVIGYEGDEAKAHSTWSTAPFNGGSSSYNSSYFTAHKSEWLNGNVLKPKYDAATVNLGREYCLPTKEDWDELIMNTNYEFIENYNGSGVNGHKITSKTDPTKYIFIPSGGYYDDSRFYDEGSDANVWSSSLDTNDLAYMFNSSSSGNFDVVESYRYFSQSLRAISRNSH